MTDTEQLAQIVIRLDAMTPRFKAPADGLGKHLGDGLPHQGASLRTVVLANAIRELIAARSRIVALEKALLDADSWVQTGEGVVLEYYHEGFGDDDSVAVELAEPSDRPCWSICAGKVRDGLGCAPGRCAVRKTPNV